MKVKSSAATALLILLATTVAASRTVAFVSIPLPGHLNPLMAQAHHLPRDSYDRILFASMPNVKRFLTTHPLWDASRMHFVAADSAECRERGAAFPEVARAAAEMEHFASGSMHILGWAHSTWPCMWSTLLPQLRAVGSDLALIVTDASTVVGFDLADELGVELVVNNCDLVYMLSDSVLPIADKLPPLFSGTSAHEMTHHLRLIQRALFPILRPILRLYVHVTISRKVNVVRYAAGRPAIDYFHVMRKRLVLVNSVIGIEYPRALPPLVQMVGPMFVEEREPPLSPAELEWLEQSDLPVVYVSMGTIAPLNREQVSVLAEAFQRGSHQFRVLWKQRRQLDEGTDDVRTPDGALIVARVSSQLRLLAHKRVKVFVSHCGINSAYEAAYYAVPVVCIPLFADQLDMAQRLVDVGMAERFNKRELNSSSIVNVLALMAVNTTYGQAAQRASDLVRLSAGAAGAAKLLDFVVRHGAATGLVGPMSNDGLAPGTADNFRFYNLDVWVFFVFLWLVAWVAYRCLLWHIACLTWVISLMRRTDAEKDKNV